MSKSFHTLLQKAHLNELLTHYLAVAARRGYDRLTVLLNDGRTLRMSATLAAKTESPDEMAKEYRSNYCFHDLNIRKVQFGKE